MARQPNRPVGFEWQEGSSEYARYARKYRRDQAKPVLQVDERQGAHLKVPRRAPQRAPLNSAKTNLATTQVQAPAKHKLAKVNQSIDAQTPNEVKDVKLATLNLDASNNALTETTKAAEPQQPLIPDTNLLFNAHETELINRPKRRLRKPNLRKSRKLPDASKKASSTEKGKSKLKSPRMSKVLYVLAALILIAAAYLAYDTFVTNQALKNIGHSKHSDNSAAAPVSDNGPPRSIEIAKLNLAAPVEVLGAKANGEIEAPKDVSSVGWYDKSAKPGKKGVIFIDGHTGTQSVPGIFDNLHTLVADDIISVERSDKLVARYKVTSVDSKPLKEINMTELLNNDPKVPEQLILMTCAGNYSQKDQTYDKRVIVRAQPAE